VLFSGDIGNRGRPILRDPAPPTADVVVMESTYGDRNHRSVAASVIELYAAINDTLRRGGNVIILSFALSAPELLYFLREGTVSGQLPRHLPVFLDSPMAISTVQIYRRFAAYFDAAAAELVAEGSDPFDMPGLRMSRDTADSMAINRVEGGAVIIAGSGMCTGGRVRHHLRHNLARPNASIVFVGFAAVAHRQAASRRAHRPAVGDEVPVRARIHTINGFSAHADQAELLNWHAKAGGRERPSSRQEGRRLERLATFRSAGPPGRLSCERRACADSCCGVGRRRFAPVGVAHVDGTRARIHVERGPTRAAGSHLTR
jgi:metallo-beta-lactamase family protein